MINKLEDFVSKIKNFGTTTASKKIDYFVYFFTIYADSIPILAKNIEDCFTTLRIPPYSNISQYLSENSKKKKNKTQKFIKVSSTYHLSRQYVEVIDKDLCFDKPKIEIENSLRELFTQLTNKSEIEFLEEAIKTFEIGAYRASIIMVWLLTLDHLFEYVLTNRLPDFIVALRRMNNNKVINTKDDFGDLKESVFIEACRGANIITNDIRKILDAKLGIRNSFAHPSTIMLPKSKALEFIEDLVNNVISKY